MYELAWYYCSVQVKTSMMANVSGCWELHDDLWKLLDRNKLFAWASLPYNVLIDVPELDDTLLAIPILLWKMQKFAMLVHNWKIAHLHEVQSVLDVLWRSHRSLLCRKILYPSIEYKKEFKLSSGCVEGVVQVLEANMLRFWRASSTDSYLPSKRSWLCWCMIAFHCKEENPIPRVLHTLQLCCEILRYFACEFYNTLHVNYIIG